MKKATKYLLILTVVSVVLFLAVHIYSYIVTWPGATAGGQDLSLVQIILMSIGHFFRRYAFFIILTVLAVWSLYFWLTMLIDCIKRDFSQSSDRLLWVIVIVLAGIVGAAVYYFIMIRKKSAGQ